MYAGQCSTVSYIALFTLSEMEYQKIVQADLEPRFINMPYLTPSVSQADLELSTQVNWLAQIIHLHDQAQIDQ